MMSDLSSVSKKRLKYYAEKMAEILKEEGKDYARISVYSDPSYFATVSVSGDDCLFREQINMKEEGECLIQV